MSNGLKFMFHENNSNHIVCHQYFDFIVCHIERMEKKKLKRNRMNRIKPIRFFYFCKMKRTYKPEQRRRHYLHSKVKQMTDIRLNVRTRTMFIDASCDIDEVLERKHLEHLIQQFRYSLQLEIS